MSKYLYFTSQISWKESLVLLSLQACAVGALLSRLLDVCYNRGLQVGDSGVEVFRNVPCAVLPEGEVSPWGEIMPGDVLGGSWMREKGASRRKMPRRRRRKRMQGRGGEWWWKVEECCRSWDPWHPQHNGGILPWPISVCSDPSVYIESYNWQWWGGLKSFSYLKILENTLSVRYVCFFRNKRHIFSSFILAQTVAL